MSTDGLDPAMLETIARARSLNDIPIDDAGLPYRSLGHLLEEQADAHEQKIFLIYYSADGQRREITYREFYEEVCRIANLSRRTRRAARRQDRDAGRQPSGSRDGIFRGVHAGSRPWSRSIRDSMMQRSPASFVLPVRSGLCA